MHSTHFTESIIQNFITHYIGNKEREEPIILASIETEYDPKLEFLLKKYFLESLPSDELFKFDIKESESKNEIYDTIQSLFASDENFITGSQSIAQKLYDSTNHPMIKKGELHVVYLKNAILEDELTDAIGIFKSETESPFIKISNNKNQYIAKGDQGYAINGLDKGCLIFNTSSEDGYRCLLLDKVNKTNEAHFWKSEFLSVVIAPNEYYKTSSFMNMTQEFIKNELTPENGINKTEQLGMLQKSVAYFKNNEQFDKEDFEKEVLGQSMLIDQFEDYKEGYAANQKIEFPEQWEISEKAVKKQSQNFKSIIKLDKNFHIYIHGESNKISKGVEQDGRKYYKIYFDNEE